MSAYGLLAYFTRITPALSVVSIVVLLVFSFVVHPHGRGVTGEGDSSSSATTWQIMLSIYTVALHIMSIVFPARVCYALGEVMRSMKELAATKEKPKGSGESLAVIKEEDETTLTPTPLFVIIIPAYKEDMNTLEETLHVLSSHAQARHEYHVYLAMEEKEEKSSAKAALLIQSFRTAFYRMSYTIHPHSIPGEAQGKSSNESWAAKQACSDYSDPLMKQNVIITVMDADTHLSSRYFSQITRLHVDDSEESQTVVYVPPIVFDRNLHHMPLAVRTADMMWAGAGISSLYAGSTVCIPTSVYSLPMMLVDKVGGWDTGPGAIGEDMHMYLKCFFALSGNLNVRVVYAAASQCNVSSDVPGARGYIDGLNARYRQALRHMWGSLDTGYTIRKTFEMLHRHWRASRARFHLSVSAPKFVGERIVVLPKVLRTACSPTWNAIYISIGMNQPTTPRPLRAERPAQHSIHKMNVFTLYQRIFEAHFLPIHLCVILTTSSIFSWLTPGFLMPDILRLALNFSGWCRLVGYILMLCYFYRYEQYHRLCVALRREEMRKAGMLEGLSDHDGFSRSVFQVAGLLEAVLFPIGGFLFGAIPALQAVISHIFTDRLVYVVSLKPQFNAIKALRGVTP